ncbi:MAG: hypothetical protein II795_01800 [Firmicutes bacterium]|nr:hypothetical protein [Bacillota bacterium]
MNIKIRLWRRPVTSLLWLLVCGAVSAFLLLGISLWYSTSWLSRTLDENHTAIAVRTDPSSIGEPRYFTQEDKAFFENMDSVKAVRSHTVSAAASPSFSPVTEINKNRSFRSNGNPLPYCLTSFIVYMNNVEERNNALYLDMILGRTMLISEDYAENDIQALAEYRREMTGMVQLAGGRDAVDFFQKEKIYLVNGYFDPGIRFSNSRNFPVSIRYPGALLLNMGFAKEKDGLLMGYLPTMETDGTGAPVLNETYAFPAAERLDLNSYEEILAYEPDAEIWTSYQEKWEIQQHSLPVIGTDHLESMYEFLTGQAYIAEGRSFTAEEYEGGSRVLILSEKMAARGELQVGDTVTLRQYLGAFEDPGDLSYGSSFSRPGSPRNNPTVDLFSMQQEYGEEEEYTLVGIYKMIGEWSWGTYDFTPNTVFMPRKAQIPGGLGTIPEEKGGDDIYGLELSIELQNGKENDFLLELDKSPYAGQFYAFDQGYEEVQKSIDSMVISMSRLMALSACGFVIFLILYLLMFQAGEKKNLGTMRSLGCSPRKAGSYLFGGGFLIAFAGVIIGSAAGGAVMKLVQNRILQDALASVNTAARGFSNTITEISLADMVRESSLGLEKLLMLAAAELAVFAVLLAIQAGRLAGQDPRRLMEG